MTETPLADDWLSLQRIAITSLTAPRAAARDLLRSDPSPSNLWMIVLTCAGIGALLTAAVDLAFSWFDAGYPELVQPILAEGKAGLAADGMAFAGLYLAQFSMLVLVWAGLFGYRRKLKAVQVSSALAIVASAIVWTVSAPVVALSYYGGDTAVWPVLLALLAAEIWLTSMYYAETLSIPAAKAVALNVLATFIVLAMVLAVLIAVFLVLSLFGLEPAL